MDPLPHDPETTFELVCKDENGYGEDGPICVPQRIRRVTEAGTVNVYQYSTERRHDSSVEEVNDKEAVESPQKETRDVEIVQSVLDVLNSLLEGYISFISLDILDIS